MAQINWQAILQDKNIGSKPKEASLFPSGSNGISIYQAS
jgi:hypothetical protein